MAQSGSQSYPRLLLVGLGAAKEHKGVAGYRSASWKAVSSFQSLLLTKVGLVLPSGADAEVCSNVARVALLSEHYFRRYLDAETTEKRKKKPMDSIAVIELEAPADQAAGRAALLEQSAEQALATLRARELANERGDIGNPAWLEEQARQIAKDGNLKFSVLHDAELAKEGLHLLRAVGQAASNKARILVLEYNGDSSPDAPLTALVGKGLTYDTGGLFIKFRGSMDNMHIDMGGAAAVLGAMSALSKLGLKVNVVAALAVAENAIGPDAFKPLTIVPSVKGTVEIQDTDAEGRLALADAMTYVQRQFKPAKLIDLATLTGAALVALGEHTAALMSNDDAMAEALLRASKSCGEQLWRMPVLPEHEEELKSTYATFRNCSTSRMGGSCVAAAFLQKYVEEGVQWCHVDLAGPAMLSKPREWNPEGGTGYGAQLLLSYLQATQAK